MNMCLLTLQFWSYSRFLILYNAGDNNIDRINGMDSIDDIDSIDRLGSIDSKDGID